MRRLRRPRGRARLAGGEGTGGGATRWRWKRVHVDKPRRFPPGEWGWGVGVCACYSQFFFLSTRGPSRWGEMDSSGAGPSASGDRRHSASSGSDRCNLGLLQDGCTTIHWKGGHWG